MDLLRIFRHNIDLDTYKQMLLDVFKADVLLDNSHIEQLPVISDDDKGYYIGNKRTSDRYSIGFFYYEIGRSNVARKKVGLRNLVHKFINSRDGQFDAALVAFRDADHWRLSFICDIKDEATAPKRFTFVFGDADNLYRTPLERFGKLQQKGITKTDIQEAFSVEALNNQFFDEYKAHYEAFVEYITGKRFVKESGKWIEKAMHAPHPYIYPQFHCEDKDVRDYVKQMMGRIVFLHFLQKKGWMGVPANSSTWEGGDQNFMFKLFDNATQEQKNDFLDAVLEPVFFECLNTKREGDLYTTPVKAIGTVRIPYLNGELFEKIELDKTECKFDVKLFENLFNLFNSYNFTIDENDPSDAEIGVDPEMLGKIFENLLEDNKDKGAFYTPKEIVSYMCKESLIAYLQSKTGKAHHDSIRTLVNTHIKDKHLEEDSKVCERLNKALREVKICDPAIGSGAFPMGLLNEIFACRCQLEIYDKPKDELKGEIIQNNIYGVDIERGAVDIARLRFWLALVVDAEKPVPLPNLDYKIMQGNSLLESYKGQDLTKFMENAFAQPFAIQLNKDLKKYFKETDNVEKLRLRKSIDFTIKQCIAQCGIQDEIELPNTDFFLWHTYFKDVFDEGGFDIVIGNPPYVSTKGRTDEEKENLERAFGFVDDLYHHFIIHGFNLLKEGGIQSMITSDTYFTTLTKTALRKKFLSLTMLQIVHWGHDIFEDALVSTATFISQKTQIADNAITFYDVKGKKSISEGVKYIISQEEYSKSINGCFYVPTPLCLGINSVLANTHNSLITEWWDKIETSKKIAKNASKLAKYRNSLKPGDVTIIGLVTDGGQGMATGDNGRFVGVKEGTKQADNIIENRPQKLAEVNRQYHLNHTLPAAEEEIWELFDNLKSQYGNKIFGQGYIYRIVSEEMLANVLSLTDNEKEHGISGKSTFVPYDKGDKDGNRWCLENPFVINWSEENVYFLKSNSGKKGTGMPVVRNSNFYFKGGFCWNNNLNEKYYNIKCREKNAGIHDVASMSLFELTPKVPAYYLVTLINSSLCGYFYRMFLNNTVNVQLNDLRMLPVIVPTETQLKEVKELFDKAVNVQRKFFDGNLTSQDRDVLLQEVQDKIDDYVFGLYGLKQSDYPKLEKTLY